MPHTFCIVLEYIEGYDLFHIITEFGVIDEKLAKTIIEQVIDISTQLSAVKIAHRDIKDENIMIDLQTLKVKLIDFGCAIEFCYNDNFTTFSGTSEFYPPEWFQFGFYCPMKGTVWSIGCLLFTLLTGMKNMSPHLRDKMEDYSRINQRISHDMLLYLFIQIKDIAT